jgi:hypothetical protein
MAFKDPEEELADLLTQLPPWAENVLWHKESLDESKAWITSHLELRWSERKEEYEAILRRIPGRWTEYCKAQQVFWDRFVGWVSPSRSIGRPRLDTLAEEAAELKQQGMSYAKIAAYLNRKYGPGKTNQEAIRKLVKSRESKANPEKT